jgi:hypothetical protein
MESVAAYQLSNCALVCGVGLLEIATISQVVQGTLHSKETGINSIAATKGRRSRVDGRFLNAMRAAGGDSAWTDPTGFLTSAWKVCTGGLSIFCIWKEELAKCLRITNSSSSTFGWMGIYPSPTCAVKPRSSTRLLRALRIYRCGALTEARHNRLKDVVRTVCSSLWLFIQIALARTVFWYSVRGYGRSLDRL